MTQQELLDLLPLLLEDVRQWPGVTKAELVNEQVHISFLPVIAHFWYPGERCWGMTTPCEFVIHTGAGILHLPLAKRGTIHPHVSRVGSSCSGNSGLESTLDDPLRYFYALRAWYTGLADSRGAQFNRNWTAQSAAYWRNIKDPPREAILMNHHRLGLKFNTVVTITPEMKEAWINGQGELISGTCPAVKEARELIKVGN